jgi:hypothetical protein
MQGLVGTIIDFCAYKNMFTHLFIAVRFSHALKYVSMPFFAIVNFLLLLKHVSYLCCDVGWLEGFLSIWCERSMVAQT